MNKVCEKCGQYFQTRFEDHKYCDSCILENISEYQAVNPNVEGFAQDNFSGAIYSLCPKCRRKKSEKKPVIRYCKKCGAVIIKKNAQYCPTCKLKQTEELTKKHNDRESVRRKNLIERFCVRCGAVIIKKNARYCPTCRIERTKELRKKYNDRASVRQKKPIEKFCARCGVKIDARRKYCYDCREILRKEKIREKFCLVCGKSLGFATNRKYCPECKKIRHDEFNRHYYREQHGERICPQCGKNPLEDRKKLCAECKAENEKKYNPWVKFKTTEKFCLTCGKSLGFATKRKFCEECYYKRHLLRKKLLRRKRKAELNEKR